MNTLRHTRSVVLLAALLSAAQVASAAMVAVTSTNLGVGSYQYTITKGSDPQIFGDVTRAKLRSHNILGLSASGGWQTSTNMGFLIAQSPAGGMLNANIVTANVTSVSITSVWYDGVSMAATYPRGIVAGTVYTTNQILYPAAASNEVTSLNVVGYERFAFFGPTNLLIPDSFVNITNPNATVTYPVTMFRLGGTNSMYTAGTIVWSNSLGGGGSVPANSTTGWAFTVSLAVGSNVVTVIGMNTWNVPSSDQAIIVREAPAAPFVDITNVTGSATSSVSAYTLKGTNSIYAVGNIVWTNARGGNGVFPTGLLTGTPTGWTFSVNLSTGANVITVTGTNIWGVPHQDSVTLTFTPPLPYVNITNVTFVNVPMSSNLWSIRGTNNAATLGQIRWTNSFSGTMGSFGFGSPGWAFNVNLGTGDNIIAITGSNAWGNLHQDWATISVVNVTISNRPASTIGATTARLNGWLYNSSVFVTNTVRVYYGTNNGGTVAANWQTNKLLGTAVPMGLINAVAAGLQPTTTYYYTFFTTNAIMGGWATNVISFITMSSNFGVRTIPRTNALLFSAMTASFPSNDYQGDWTQYCPTGIMTAMATPTVEPIAGRQWVMNDRYDFDGYRQGYYPNSTNVSGNVVLPCQGVSLFTVLVPTRNTQGDAWNSVIDVMYDVVRLGVRNDTGIVSVNRRGSNVNSTYAIPNRQMTILSVLVMTNGSFKVWANGSNIMNEATTTIPITNLFPAVDNGYNKYINIGRNNPDAWSTFNGNIGDVFFYTNTLTDTERQQLEADIYTNFFSMPRTVARPENGITPTAVTLNGELLHEGIGGSPEVYVCYGTVDGGQTSPTNWQYTESVSASLATGLFSKTLTGLTPATLYFYAFYALNASGEAWSDYVATFGTANAPAVSNETPYSVRVSTARARGYLTATNFAPTSVILYHGTNDGGTDAANWQFADNLGLRSIGRLDSIITNIPGTYYYRYYATNPVGETWADSTMMFTPTDTPFDGGSNGYIRSIVITFNGYSGSKPLADYPALVKLNASAIPGFAYYQFLSGNNDIRFAAADGSLLSHEIDTWNTSGDSYIWVRVPVLESNTVVRMFYAKTGESAPTDPTNTWDDGFVAVWHMTNTLGKNATGNTAFDIGSTWGTPADGAGLLGLCQDFPGGSGLRVGDMDLPETFSLSFLAYLDTTEGDRWNIQKDTWANYSLMCRYGNWEFNINYWNYGGTWASTPATATTWTHIAGTYDGTALRLYKNGGLMQTLARTGMTQNNTQTRIGDNVDGRIDEVRAERVTRSADWIAATHKNMTGAYAFAAYAVSNLVAIIPGVFITNVTGVVDLPGSTTSYKIAGTNNQDTVGGITWTNWLTGATGSVPASSTGWVFTTSVMPGDNVVQVVGTNYIGLIGDEMVTLRVPSVKVATMPATEVATFGAMLNGSVNPYDVQTYTRFEYGTTTNYGSTTAWTTAGSGGGYIPCSNAVGSLAADTIYHCRAVASNINGFVVTGSNTSFRTLPLIATLDATNILAASAVLNGKVIPAGLTSFAWFEWGTSTNYGTLTSPATSVGSGSNYVFFGKAIAGLTADTIYHFRAVSSNGAGIVYGEDKAFIAGRNITQNGLYFCVLASSLPSSDGAETGPWAQALPANGTTFPNLGNPTVSVTNSAKWARNYDGDEGGTGYRARDLSANPSIPCQGVTIVANVQPIYYPSYGGERGEVVDIFYDRLALAVAVGDGRIMVARNGTIPWADYGPALPEGVKTVLSLVVQPDGSFVCYTNGASAMTGTASGQFTNMAPTGLEAYKRYVNIGRNNPDAWSAFNGLLGDIFVYTNALTDAERQEVEKGGTAVIPVPSDVENFLVGRGADYGQVSLAWSNGFITVLWCTNRLYSSSPSSWSILASGVSSPWTHTDASNYPSVYYRIVSGTYTSQYDVGKFDVQIAAGGIAWLSFPFNVQIGCDVLGDWFGQQLEARPYAGFNFPSLQRQTSPGGAIVNSDYYLDVVTTNWVPNSTIDANVGYVLFLPNDHGAVKVTGIGMVPTNAVTMQLPYSSIPWVGLAYPISLDMRQSGLSAVFTPARKYSTFNYDFADSQESAGGPVRYAEYYIDDWGSGATNFFPSVAGADYIEGGKGYLLFFGTGRAGTGTWTCAKPY